MLRKKAKTLNLLDMNNSLSSLYYGNTNQNSTVMELNSTQYNRFKDNCILVASLRICSDTNHVYYNSVAFGSKVSVTKESSKFGTNHRNMWINLNKTKSRLVMIITPKAEFIKVFPNAHVFGTVLTYHKKKHGNKLPPTSGFIILMKCMLPSKKSTYIFDNEMYTIVSKCKPNSLKSFDHHGTKGYSYSFGNKPLYGNINGSSVSTYTPVRHKNEKKQDKLVSQAEYVHQKCSQTIRNGIVNMSKVIPELKHMLSPIINAAYAMQCDKDVKFLTKDITSDVGCWNAFLFVEGRTEYFHVENDCAYTFITVPQQNQRKYLHPTHEPVFLFKLNELQTLTLPLHNDLSFIYNASLLTHRQRYEPDLDMNSTKFFNISSYGNAKLFNHLRKSFGRLNDKL